MLTVNELFKSQLKVANVGLESFYTSVQSQNTPAVQVDWKPPASLSMITVAWWLLPARAVRKPLLSSTSWAAASPRRWEPAAVT